MTQFEQMLLDNGYVKHTLNCQTLEYEVAIGNHIISTMVNLGYVYIDNRKERISFGLNEPGKPPTLVSPRPRIEVKRIRNGKSVIENEQFDDSMNVVLQYIPHDEILKAIYDTNICLKIDLTV